MEENSGGESHKCEARDLSEKPVRCINKSDFIARVAWDFPLIFTVVPTHFKQ